MGLTVTENSLNGKINSDSTLYTSTNYWAPLAYDDDIDNDDTNDTTNGSEHTALPVPSEIAQALTAIRPTFKTVFEQWLRQRCGIRRMSKRNTMVIDSGATSHFVRQSEQLQSTGPSDKVVMLPNGSTIAATHTVDLPFRALSTAARKAHVLPNLTSNSLVSVPKLADAGYTTIFHAGNSGVTIHDDNEITIQTRKPAVLQGWRDKTGLWRLDCEDTKTNRIERKSTAPGRQPSTSGKPDSAANVYTLPSIKRATKFLHAAAGFPTKDTWLQAISRGYYRSWPGITPRTVRRHFPDDSKETHKGHMKKQRQNVRSTKQHIIDDSMDQTHHLSKQQVLVKVINATQTIYTDQTGRFPVQSSRGNGLLMVIFDVDANYIDAEPLIDNKDMSLIKAYQTLWERITKTRNHKPKMHILDNEASAAFKSEIRKNCELQLVPPDTHRANLAERAIQTFKAHFISVLSGVDPSFPMELWDRLIPQTVLTLNLLRTARATPTMSAYHYVNGAFDYNRTPLAPLGCKVQMHN